MTLDYAVAKTQCRTFGVQQVNHLWAARVVGWSLIIAALIICSSLIRGCGVARAYTNEQIANAIYVAEGGGKTPHPYGILPHYKHTTSKQACLNTIAHAKRDFRGGDFIAFLGNRYAPVGAANDPYNLNTNWVRNVRCYLNRQKVALRPSNRGFQGKTMNDRYRCQKCEVARAENIYLSIISRLESGNNPLAYNRISHATGQYQITPVCLKDYNLSHKGSKITLNALYVRIPQLLRIYRIKDSITTRLWTYNSGIGKLKRGILPLETKNYIEKYKREGI